VAPATPQKRNLLVSVKDSTCKPPGGIIFQQVLTIPIVITDTVQLSVTKNYSYCQYDAAQPLSGTGTGLLWYTEGSETPNTTAPVPSTDKAGTFTYYAEANNGCYSLWDTITVNILPKAEADIITTADTICFNETVTLENKLHKPQGVNYVWGADGAVVSNNTGKTISVYWSTKGLKKVKLYAYNSECNQSDSIYIYVTDIFTGGYFSMKDSACVNEKVQVILNVKNNRRYLIETTDTSIYGKDEKEQWVWWRNYGKKNVILTTLVEDCINRPYSLPIYIYQQPDATILLLQDKVCAGQRMVLYTEQRQDIKYAWQPAELFDVQDNYIAQFKNGILKEVNISLSVTDAHNCTNTDDTTLTPVVCCTYALPNAFSPNGDGLNDVFGPIRFMSFAEYTMLVTNRWGQVVFKSSDVNEKWDGTFKGIPQDAGTYYYYIAYKCIGDVQQQRERGDVQLIR
jgi:gliding motility-associated-like protein